MAISKARTTVETQLRQFPALFRQFPDASPRDSSTGPQMQVAQLKEVRAKALQLSVVHFHRVNVKFLQLVAFPRDRRQAQALDVLRTEAVLADAQLSEIAGVRRDRLDTLVGDARVEQL